MGDSRRNLDVVDVAVPVLEGSADGLVVLPGEDEDLPGRRSEAGGIRVGRKVGPEQGAAKE